MRPLHSTVSWGACLAAATILFAWAEPTAGAQDFQDCHLVRAHPAGMLQKCGDRLRSLTLVLNDVRRRPSLDARGAFVFACPMAMMCADEPGIMGWMIKREDWAGSGRDETAIHDVLNKAPNAVASMLGARERPASACGLLDMDLAGLPGRAVCYDFDKTRSSAIVAVAANDDIGFIFVFYAPQMTWQALREKVETIRPRLALERAQGDAELLKWMVR